MPQGSDEGWIAMSATSFRIPTRLMAVLAIVATASLWGASMPMVKQLVDTVPPSTLAALRLGIALLVLLPVLALQGKRPCIGRTTVLLGLTGVAASHLLQNYGMELMPAGPAAVVLLAGTVVLTTMLGRCMLGERCSMQVVLAMLGCGLGVALVALASGGAGMAFPLLGLLLILGAAATWAVYAVIGRRTTGQDPLAVTAGALLVGLVALLPFVAFERPTVETVSLGGSDWLSLVVLGSVVTAGSYFCFGYGIRHLQANEASVLCSVEPAFGLIFAWLLLREGISLQEAIGAAVIVASCMLVARGETSPVVVSETVVEAEPQAGTLVVAL